MYSRHIYHVLILWICLLNDNDLLQLDFLTSNFNFSFPKPTTIFFNLFKVLYSASNWSHSQRKASDESKFLKSLLQTTQHNLLLTFHSIPVFPILCFHIIELLLCFKLPPLVCSLTLFFVEKSLLICLFV